MRRCKQRNLRVSVCAGYETTANALSFAIFLLAQNPDAVRKLTAEIDALGGKCGPPAPTPAEVSSAALLVDHRTRELVGRQPLHGTRVTQRSGEDWYLHHGCAR